MRRLCGQKEQGVLGSWCPEEHRESKIPAWKKKLLKFLLFKESFFFFSTQSTLHWWSIERIKKPKLSTIESRINYPRRSKEQYSCFSLVYASPPTEWSHCPPSLAACSLVSIYILMLLSPPFFLENTLLLILSCSFSSRFTICHKTEVVKNTLNPVWQPFTIPVRALCNGDFDRYRADSPFSLHLLIGTAAVYPFTAAFSCFCHASPASSSALKTLTPTVLSLGGQHGGSLQNSPNTKIAQPAERLQFLYFCMRGVW